MEPLFSTVSLHHDIGHSIIFRLLAVVAVVLTHFHYCFAHHYIRVNNREGGMVEEANSLRILGIEMVERERERVRRGRGRGRGQSVYL